MAEFGVIDLGRIYRNADAYRQNAMATQMQQMQMRKAMKAEEDQNALAQIFRQNYQPEKQEPVMYQPQGPMPDGGSMPAVPTGETKTTPGGMNMRGAINEMYQRFPMQAMQFEQSLRKAQGETPSSIREWQLYNAMSAEDQARYRTMKRADKWQDIGSELILPGTGGMPDRRLAKDLKPGERPDVRAAQARAAKMGGEQGEQESLLTEMEANFPRLEEVTKQLSVLGQKATYTKSGQFRDTLMREAGRFPGESAVARKEYISKVDNEILPLLRQTFGAAFTQKEGETLKNTLGDPNASPEEKEAVLRSFIDSKKAQILTQKRRVGLNADPTQGALPPKETRVAGKMYDLPSGRYVWTTGGWVPVK